MPGMLSRSRSLRLLRGGPKESHQDDGDHFIPPPAHPQAELERLKARTPVPGGAGRVETPDLSDRPRTSGGPGDRGRLFHRKINPVSPNNADSPSSIPFPSPAKSTTTVLYTAEVHESTEGFIGIALGSPTMNPPWSTTPQGTSDLGTVTHISSNTAIHKTTETTQEAPKPKISRWKSIFGKKPHPPQPTKQTFYQLAQAVAPPRADSHHDDESLDSRSISRAAGHRDDSRSGSPPVFRPEIRESRKLPRGQEQPKVETRPRALTATTPPVGPKTSLMRSASSPRPQLNNDLTPVDPVPQVVVTGSSQLPNATGLRSGTSPLLDIEIPSVKLDRYSVMFGSLLQSNSNTPSNRSSSLLMRRQGNSDRLKPLTELSTKNEDEGSHLKPQRRATSPSHAPKSPAVSLSLFPPPLSVKAPSPRPGSSHRKRQLRRSNTAPASSPGRPNFATDQETSKVVKGELEPQKNEVETHESEDLNLKSQLLTPTPSSRNSFDSDSENITVMAGASPTAPFRPLGNEPQWELVRRPTQKEALRSHPTTTQAIDQAPSSAPMELDRTKKFKAQTVELAPLSADQTPSSRQQSQTRSPTATVGIARSVSVSRASPRSADVASSTLIRRATEKSLSPASGRFIDQKPLTPTLVELKNRKSQRVQLVDALE